MTSRESATSSREWTIHSKPRRPQLPPPRQGALGISERRQKFCVTLAVAVLALSGARETCKQLTAEVAGRRVVKRLEHDARLREHIRQRARRAGRSEDAPRLKRGRGESAAAAVARVRRARARTGQTPRARRGRVGGVRSISKSGLRARGAAGSETGRDGPGSKPRPRVAANAEEMANALADALHSDFDAESVRALARARRLKSRAVSGELSKLWRAEVERKLTPASGPARKAAAVAGIASCSDGRAAPRERGRSARRRAAAEDVARGGRGRRPRRVRGKRGVLTAPQFRFGTAELRRAASPLNIFLTVDSSPGARPRGVRTAEVCPELSRTKRVEDDEYQDAHGGAGPALVSQSARPAPFTRGGHAEAGSAATAGSDDGDYRSATRRGSATSSRRARASPSNP